MTRPAVSTNPFAVEKRCPITGYKAQWGYHEGCRCRVCTDGVRHARRMALESLGHVHSLGREPGDVPSGVCPNTERTCSYSYTKLKCRCETCKSWNNDRSRRTYRKPKPHVIKPHILRLLAEAEKAFMLDPYYITEIARAGAIQAQRRAHGLDESEEPVYDSDDHRIAMVKCELHQCLARSCYYNRGHRTDEGRAATWAWRRLKKSESPEA